MKTLVATIVTIAWGLWLGGLGTLFAVLGTVARTPSHLDVEPLGWARVAELLRATPLPVYALGGLSRDDLDTAIAHGAHGIALRRAAWND